MTAEEAYAVLGISPESNEGAIRTAHHNLCQIHHPDKATGDTIRQVEINQAAEVALAALSERRALVSVRNSQALNKVETMLVAEQAARNAAGHVASVKRRQIGPLNRLKHLAWLSGGIAAAVAWLPEKVLPLFSTDEAARLKPVFGVITLVVLAAGGVLQFLTSQLQHRIDALSDRLDDPRNCAEALAAILRYKDTPNTDESALRPSEFARSEERHELPIGPFPFAFVRAVSAVERERLIQLRAIQHGLITALPSDLVTPTMITTYKINFKPSLFRREPPPAPKPVTAADAKGMAKAATVGFAIFGGIAAFMVLSYQTWWAVLPALPAIGMGVVIVDAISHLLMKRKPDSADTSAEPPS